MYSIEFEIVMPSSRWWSYCVYNSEECGFWSGGAATRADVVPCIRQGLLDSPAGLHLQNPGVPNEFASGDGGRVLFHAVPRR